MESVSDIIKKAEKSIFAKHGGKSVVNITLFNAEGSVLLADIRRIEKTLKIEMMI